MTEDRLWAIRKRVSTYEDGLLHTDVEKVLDEPLLPSREDCEKRAEILNESDPSGLYFCEQAEGLTV